jgi:hypothetical protein
MPKTHAASGSYPNWASDAADSLLRHDRHHPEWPRGEIISRGLQKLSRQIIGDPDQLQRLLTSVVLQVLADLHREKRRLEDSRSAVDATTLPASSPGLPAVIQERLDWLLAPDSPLDELEKTVLLTALMDPRKFLYKDGQLRQKALGLELGVDQKTIFNRWTRIRQKVSKIAAGKLSPEIML